MSMVTLERQKGFSPFQKPITSVVGASMETQGEKIACSAPEIIPYATAHTTTPEMLCEPIQVKEVTAQAKVVTITELKKPRPESAMMPRA